MAASGIDSTIKIFSPDRRAQRDARLGRNLGITPDQDIIHSSIAWSRRRRSNRQRDDNDDTPAPEPAAPTRDDDADEGETDDAADPAVPPRGGRASRRRMRDSYQITSQNDVERRGGQRDAFLTVSGPSFPIRVVPVSFAAWMALIGGGGGAGPGR